MDINSINNKEKVLKKDKDIDNIVKNKNIIKHHKHHKPIYVDIIPNTLEKEDLSISPIESMIFDFENNKYNSIIFPLKGNIFPYIEPIMFSKIKHNNRKINK
jgi:hypothetical protein